MKASRVDSGCVAFAPFGPPALLPKPPDLFAHGPLAVNFFPAVNYVSDRKVLFGKDKPELIYVMDGCMRILSKERRTKAGARCAYRTEY